MQGIEFILFFGGFEGIIFFEFNSINERLKVSLVILDFRQILIVLQFQKSLQVLERRWQNNAVFFGLFGQFLDFNQSFLGIGELILKVGVVIIGVLDRGQQELMLGFNKIFLGIEEGNFLGESRFLGGKDGLFMGQQVKGLLDLDNFGLIVGGIVGQVDGIDVEYAWE